jgi:acyl-CoA synthetase (AMP-forming)/AMP-acid ligase II
METPLTPLEFARRARKLYPDRIAVIDGDSRWTYAQFLNRCDRWSAALQKLGIRPGDRVAYLSPNTHTQLESFYAVPQIGAVLVPLNYRLTADDFVYLINHSGSRMVCVDREYLATIDSIRSRLPCVEHFVALNAQGEDWLDYEAMIDASPGKFTRPEIHETDLLTINYTSGTTAHPKGVMITHRNAWMNSIGTLLYAPMTCADVSRQRLDFRLDSYGRRSDSHLSAQGRTARRLRINGERAGDNIVRSANSFDFTGERAGVSPSPGAERNSRCHGRCAARGFHHPATRRRVWLDDHPCLRTDRDSAVHYRVRATGGTCAPPDQGTGRDQSAPGCGANYIR